MKKITKVLIVLMLMLLTAAVFAACGNENDRQTSTSAPIKLEAPTNLSVEAETITWTAVTNAVSYNVQVDNNQVNTVNTHYSLNFTEEKEFIIKVQAVSADGSLYNSDWTQTSYTLEPVLPRLGTPINIRFASVFVGDATLLWDEVDDAYAYRISIDGILYTSVITSFSFKENNLTLGNAFNIRIRALADDIINSHSLWSEEKLLTAKSKLTAPTDVCVGAIDDALTSGLVPVVLWNKVAGADYYEISLVEDLGNGVSWSSLRTYTVKGTESFLDSIYYYDLSFFTQEGKYLVRIRAISANENILTSDYSNLSTYNDRLIIEKLSFTVTKDPYAGIDNRKINCAFLNSDSRTFSSYSVKEYEIIVNGGEVQKISFISGHPHVINLNNIIPAIPGNYTINIRAISNGKVDVYSIGGAGGLFDNNRAINYLDSDWVTFVYTVV